MFGKVKWSILISLLFGILSLTSCKEMMKSKGAAEAAIVDFHRQFNDGKFKELYAAGDSELRSAATEADFLKLLEAVHRKLGNQVKSTGEGWRINTVNSETTAVITQKTQFEKGKGVETFNYSISGGSCKLQGYHIDSQDMLID